MEHDGNGWVRCDLGDRHWGRHGAAGLLLTDHRGDEPLVLLQHRAAWTASGDTWGIPGGARDSHESPSEAALREAYEETGIPAEAIALDGDELVDDHGHWSYTTVLATLHEDVTLVPQEESAELRWVPSSQVTDRELHPGFAATWPTLRARVESD